MRRTVFAAVALAIVLAVRTSAQMPEAQKWENVEWYWVDNWQLTGPDADSAMTIFFDHALPVMTEVWPDMRCLRLLTGEWNITCSAPMTEGLGSLEWRRSPRMARFMALLFEREGEAVVGMGETFEKAVARHTSQLALKHTGGM